MILKQKPYIKFFDVFWVKLTRLTTIFWSEGYPPWISLDLPKPMPHGAGGTGGRWSSFSRSSRSTLECKASLSLRI